MVLRSMEGSRHPWYLVSTSIQREFSYQVRIKSQRKFKRLRKSCTIWCKEIWTWLMTYMPTSRTAPRGTIAWIQKDPMPDKIRCSLPSITSLRQKVWSRKVEISIKRNHSLSSTNMVIRVSFWKAVERSRSSSKPAISHRRGSPPFKSSIGRRLTSLSFRVIRNSHQNIETTCQSCQASTSMAYTGTGWRQIKPIKITQTLW